VRLLCDNHVPTKYITAFEAPDELEVLLVRDVLSPSASDGAIARYAAANECAVFTNDDDFYTDELRHGLILYSQIEDPPPGEVVDAVVAIDAAYDSATDIVEFVPDGWI
jgi:hypothetical protein